MNNIIFYFTDQQRADTCGCYGQQLDITPNLDALAEEGTLFENAFTPQPVCGPCRSIFQSGKYPTETGCFRNNLMLPHTIKTLANYLEETGYQTAYIGKWHLASDGPVEGEMDIDHSITAIPLEYRGGYTGFWRASDVLEFTSHGYDGYVFDEDNNRVDFTGYRVDKITDFAMEFLDKRQKDKPFFMTISHIEPHHQNDRKHYEGPDGSKERFANFKLPKDLESLGGNAKEEYPDYLGCCRSLDDNLGRLIAKLKEQGIYENTTIVFSSDHGSHFKTRNTDAHLHGADDYKRSCHDASIHVPLVIKGAGYPKNIRIADVVSTVSLPKSFLAMAGVDVGADMVGENLSAVANGELPDRANEAFVQISESRLGRAIRTPDYTYAVYAPNIDGSAQASAETYADDFLYDLQKDPYQLNNLIADPSYAEVKAHLRERLLYWIEKEEHVRPQIVDSVG